MTGVDTAGGLGVGAGKIAGDTATYSGESRMMGMKMKTRETMGMKSRAARKASTSSSSTWARASR